MPLICLVCLWKIKCVVFVPYFCHTFSMYSSTINAMAKSSYQDSIISLALEQVIGCNSMFREVTISNWVLLLLCALPVSFFHKVGNSEACEFWWISTFLLLLILIVDQSLLWWHSDSKTWTIEWEHVASTLAPCWQWLAHHLAKVQHHIISLTFTVTCPHFLHTKSIFEIIHWVWSTLLVSLLGKDFSSTKYEKI